MPKNPSLSIILLAYNEEASIGAVLEETLAFARAELDDFEVIVIDDGSTDGTASEVKALQSGVPQLRLVSHDVNRGMGGGMHSGIRVAQKEYLVFNAADGQIPAAEIAKLLPLLEEADIALSTYQGRRESWDREWISRGFRVYLRLVAGIRFRLEGLYLFPTALAQTLEPYLEADTFFFSFSLIELALRRGANSACTQIALKPRQAGNSKVLRPGRIARVAADAFRFGVLKRSLLKRP